MSTEGYETYLTIGIGQNIRKYRLAKGLSQEKLSEMVSANPKFIGHVERVERNISMKKIIRIAKVLEIEPIGGLIAIKYFS